MYKCEACDLECVTKSRYNIHCKTQTHLLVVSGLSLQDAKRQVNLERDKKASQTYLNNLGKTLFETHPEVMKELHPIKNKEKDLNSYRMGNEDDDIWWFCPKVTCHKGCPHEYPLSIKYRIVHGSGCPYCSRKKICAHNSIVATHPEILANLHSTKNEGVDPTTLSYGSNKQLIWTCPKKCPKGCPHEDYPASVNDIITKSKGCPACNRKKFCIHESIVETNPEVMKEWDYSLNKNIDPATLSYGMDTHEYWWRCLVNPKHTWKSNVYKRTVRHKKCPHCYPKTDAEESNVDE